MIGVPTIADAVCDGLVHNAHRIRPKGESMRKTSLTAGSKPANGSPEGGCYKPAQRLLARTS